MKLSPKARQIETAEKSAISTTKALGHTLGPWKPVSNDKDAQVAECSRCFYSVAVDDLGPGFAARGIPMRRSCDDLRRPHIPTGS